MPTRVVNRAALVLLVSLFVFTCASPATTTTTPPTTPIPNCGNYTIDNSVGVDCTGTMEGDTCVIFGCDTGYSNDGATEVICAHTGLWTAYCPNATADASCKQPACTDFNACAVATCTIGVSECEDLPPPSISYLCPCRTGYYGTPGADGSGCG